MRIRVGVVVLAAALLVGTLGAASGTDFAEPGTIQEIADILNVIHVVEPVDMTFALRLDGRLCEVAFRDGKGGSLLIEDALGYRLEACKLTAPEFARGSHIWYRLRVFPTSAADTTSTDNSQTKLEVADDRVAPVPAWHGCPRSPRITICRQPYRHDLLMRIAQNWKPSQPTDVTVSITIDCFGNLIDSRILESSGHRSLDKQALAAVAQTEFAPLPDWYKGGPLEFKLQLKSKGYPGITSQSAGLEEKAPGKDSKTILLDGSGDP
jgi:TonB family protein